MMSARTSVDTPGRSTYARRISPVRGFCCWERANTAFFWISSSVDVRRIESSMSTARSLGTCDSQNTACERTSRSGSLREVRSQAVFWLSQVPSDRAVDMLDSILRTSTDEEIQKKAVFALSQQQNPRTGEILRAYVERPGVSTDVRADIIFQLGQR